MKTERLYIFETELGRVCAYTEKIDCVKPYLDAIVKTGLQYRSRVKGIATIYTIYSSDPT